MGFESAVKIAGARGDAVDLGRIGITEDCYSHTQSSISMESHFFFFIGASLPFLVSSSTLGFGVSFGNGAKLWSEGFFIAPSSSSWKGVGVKFWSRRWISLRESCLVSYKVSA